MYYMKLTAKQAYKRLQSGEHLEYHIDWTGGWYSGSDVKEFTAQYSESEIAREIRNAVLDRQGIARIQRRGWAVAERDRD